MSFSRQVLATIVGLIIFSFLSFLFIMIMLGIAGSIVGSRGEGKELNISKNSILKLDFSYNITQQDGYLGYSYNSPFSVPEDKAGLHTILNAIEQAINDDHIKGMYLKLSIMPNGMASTELIRKKLLEFKESGKPIIAYGNTFDQKSYYLASACSKVYLNPAGAIMMPGFGAQITFYKRFLDKLDATVQVFKVGDFKSAVEPYIRENMSESNKEQLNFVLSDIKDRYIKNVSASRDISEDKVNQSLNKLVGAFPDSCLSYRLLDGLKYADEIEKELKEIVGVKDDDDLHLISFNNYALAIDKETTKADKIAVLYAEGDIIDGKSMSGSIGGDDLSKQIKELRENESIDAIVLRVNSPGGSALASELIWREVLLTKEVKPVVVSMANVAASGGYYISCAANKIYAEPSTITGSIGVFGLVPNVEKLMNNRLGITFDEVNLNDHATMNGVVKAFDTYEAKVIQESVENVYATFIERVANGRAMPENDVLPIAGGRIWTGNQALDLGLVDEIGSFKEAINAAAELAGVDEYRINEYPKRKTPIESMMEQFGEAAYSSYLSKRVGVLKDYVYELENVEKYSNGIQARMVYDFEF